ncbi:MAG: class I SAM-dependent methyltransferase, partial [Myxococcota bacterium]
MNASAHPHNEQINRTNLDFWQQESTVDTYGEDSLQIPEAVILIRHREEIAGRRIFDLGCGTGRTTTVLCQLSPHYTGLDYSQTMLDRCHQRFPDLPFHCCDVRHMDHFASASFDFILFSYNGLDYVDHDGRMAALGHIHRLLVPGGLFVFSSHNRTSIAEDTGPRLKLARGLRAVAFELKDFVRSSINHLRRRSLQVRTDEYAILNDEGAEYSMLTYYIAPDQQAAQLERNGFEFLEMYDLDGRQL